MSNPLLILVQARMNSSRFPGKIMKEVLGIPLLVHQLNRIARIKTLAKIVVITSDQPSDDIIESTSLKYGYEVFRGSLLDLLDRHYQAAVFYQASTIVKIPSDCPLIDTAVIDRVLSF
jgi:spore coat polysaccharide biosynthesis protein SpsF